MGLTVAAPLARSDDRVTVASGPYAGKVFRVGPIKIDDATSLVAMSFGEVTA